MNVIAPRRFTLDSHQRVRVARVLRVPLVYRNWWSAYTHLYLTDSTPGDITYRIRNGARLSVQGVRCDIGIVNEVFLARAYEPTEAFSIRPGWTVIDAGANKGVFTVYAAHAHPSTVVHAVEPVPENVGFLQRNISLNKLRNVIVHRCALAGHSGTERICLTSKPDAHSFFAPVGSAQQTGSIVVQTVTLDELVDRAGGSVDLLKMDIEGAEYQVLRNASPATLWSIRKVVMECHGTDDMTRDEVEHEIHAILRRNGFTTAISTTYGRLLYGIAESVR